MDGHHPELVSHECRVEGAFEAMIFSMPYAAYMAEHV